MADAIEILGLAQPLRFPLCSARLTFGLVRRRMAAAWAKKQNLAAARFCSWSAIVVSLESRRNSGENPAGLLAQNGKNSDNHNSHQHEDQGVFYQTLSLLLRVSTTCLSPPFSANFALTQISRDREAPSDYSRSGKTKIKANRAPSLYQMGDARQKSLMRPWNKQQPLAGVHFHIPEKRP